MQPSLRTHLSSNDINIDLRRILDFIAQSCKYITNEIKKSNRQLAGTMNLSGEQQLALDVIADKILLERLKKEKSFSIRDFVSEEQDQIITLDTSNGRYSVTVDPLDGSSLVDVNLSIGTIIGVHEGPILANKSGHETMVAAMYIVYGPLTSLVYTAKNGTHEFVLDIAGNFVLTKENIRIKEKGSIYSTGGLRGEWLPGHKKYIEDLENQGYKLRYSGGFVPDINQILLKGGGLFTYPATKKDKNGKLRLLFELQPMALLMEQADGSATDGFKEILDIVPVDLNQRSSVYIGSKQEVKLAGEYIQKDYN